MPPGRPQRSRLAAALSEGAWHEVLILGKDDRLTISGDVSRRRAWLSPGNELLAVLSPHRTVRLMPGSEAGPVEAKLQALAAESDIGAEAAELAIRRRFLRLRVNSDSRVVVPKDIRACLSLDPVGPAYVSLTIGRHRVLLEATDESVYSEAEQLLEAYELP